ncbi:DNA alkylation repair protein [Mumia zhuanghuii]|uniref:DNA alkylation repair protein n=2 Tax=Mumia TaxID=1546255 RepID=A0ABW1QH74_9ACTN|nr:MULTISPECIES: DNA alkylation repair protein [Mumia]KAA1425330.1 DNA alkylation repair protein [Mumia zhuanghuii]
MTDDAVSVAAAITRALAEHARPERAAAEARYLKSSRTHLGVGVPATRSITRAALAGSAATDRTTRLAVARTLWASPVHEHLLAAVVVLADGAGGLGCDDLALVEELVRTAGTWALVDPLATEVAAVVSDDGADGVRCGDTLDRWAVDDDFWVRRAALLALMPPLRRGRGDWARFGRYADAMLDEREFFVRKAIGWVLRETAKKRPEIVAAWIADRPGRVPVLAVREAVRRMDPAGGDPLIAAAYRAR